MNQDVLSEERNALENTMRITDYTNGRTMNVPDTYQPSLLITKNKNSSGFNRLNEEEAVEALISNSSDF